MALTLSKAGRLARLTADRTMWCGASSLLIRQTLIQPVFYILCVDLNKKTCSASFLHHLLIHVVKIRYGFYDVKTYRLY